ncbi:MAG TPA: hypothetical protein PKW59_14505 [Thermotogota bacterium]|nr:hypothetical protein [Thermotogota bacterium]
MGLVFQTNKRTGITYVYENEAYWDKDKKTIESPVRCLFFNYRRKQPTQPIPP